VFSASVPLVRCRELALSPLRSLQSCRDESAGLREMTRAMARAF